MKRYIYLISPQKIRGASFYKKLNNLLKISKKVKKIVKKNNVKFLINDNPIVAKIVNADGCHIGQKDMDLMYARKILGKNKIIGVTCHNSKKLALKAKKYGANYVAFGSFFKSSTKKLLLEPTYKYCVGLKKKLISPPLQ